VRVDHKLGMELQQQLGVGVPRLLQSFGGGSGESAGGSGAGAFVRLGQSLAVYALNVAGCSLLRAALHSQPQSEQLALNVIDEMGLGALAPREVLALLQRRSDIVLA